MQCSMSRQMPAGSSFRYPAGQEQIVKKPRADKVSSGCAYDCCSMRKQMEQTSVTLLLLTRKWAWTVKQIILDKPGYCKQWKISVSMSWSRATALATCSLCHFEEFVQCNVLWNRIFHYTTHTGLQLPEYIANAPLGEEYKLINKY